MRILCWVVTLLAVLLLSQQAVLAAKKLETDHPLLAPYAGSSIYRKDVKQYDEYTVFKGWDKKTKQYNTQILEGKVTKILYSNPKERSILELYRNYQNALKDEGVSIIYECNQSDMGCVDGYVGAHLRTRFGINSIGNKAGRLMFAKLDQDEQIACLLLAVGEKYSDVHVVEIKKMDTGKVVLNLGALTDELDKQGFVVLEGIYFDSDKTELKVESKPAIDEVVKLLKERPDLELYVVGHTDMLGNLSHNMTLSAGRANAVVDTLVNEHDISLTRLEARGIGPLSPVASNTQEAGRSKNRRVVLVQR